MGKTTAGERETVLRLSGITKQFGALLANDDISLSLRRGEILGLLGYNYTLINKQKVKRR